jgi:hypothetical protein
VNRVEALTITAAESTAATKRRMVPWSRATIATVWPEEKRRIWAIAPMLSALTLAAVTAEPAIPPYAVGGLALAILLGLLLALIAFGGGREHS